MTGISFLASIMAETRPANPPPPILTFGVIQFRAFHCELTASTEGDMWQHNYEPIGGSLGLSTAAAVVPILVLFVMLGVMRKPAWMAALSRRA